ncbi:M14 family metallopeptidase [Haliea sp. E17]|uniref:M14 family metallopeptidase n=1 Tax=Haliea sp. E17 TaxID=3401576 RepID=UPI003AAE16B7
MADSPQYPIGTPGIPWSGSEKQAWFAMQAVRRSYAEEVLDSLRDLPSPLRLEQYGALPIDPGRYPLFAVRNRDWDPAKPCALVTGGVHGYETSGVQGALRLLQSCATDYLQRCNLLVAPAVSPWAYETINRWNPAAVDPNRSFRAGSESPEAIALMDWLKTVEGDFLLHIDLHETTDTDNSEFRPALEARDGITQAVWHIPDGFYLVGDSAQPAPGLQQAIIEAVAKVTHIAPADEDGNLLGDPMAQHGVINYPVRQLGLCAGVTNAPFRTTTEVYPDSPRVDPENCIQAQVAAVTAALEFALSQKPEPCQE